MKNAKPQKKNSQGSTQNTSKQTKPDQAAETPLTAADRTSQAQADYQKFSQMAALPNLDPQTAAWARNLARSAKASVQLGQGAMAYADPASGTPEADPNLTRLLQIPLTPSTQPNQAPSIKPETFG